MAKEFTSADRCTRTGEPSATGDFVRISYATEQGMDGFYLPVAEAQRLAREIAEITGAFSFQERVQHWMQACFGAEISADRLERNHRFLEEALELVQACGATRDDALALVAYVFDRPAGNIAQEVGGVMITLAALADPNAVSMTGAGEKELARIWEKLEPIRAKQATKPHGSPLPAPAVGSTGGGGG